MTASWADFTAEAPEFAAFVRSRFEEHGLALLATLAQDGSPRISGLEPILTDDELWLAMMPRSVKGADLRRDGRFALHNATVDKIYAGDVKISGVTVLIADRDRSSVPGSARRRICSAPNSPASRPCASPPTGSPSPRGGPVKASRNGHGDDACDRFPNGRRLAASSIEQRLGS